MIKKVGKVKVSVMYSNISHKFGFPTKRKKQRIFETITWKSYLNLIFKSKGVLLVEVAPPYVG